MTRRNFSGNGSLLPNSGYDDVTAEDADPRVGLVNLADVMLVFACGLMLSLVTLLNIDMSSFAEVVKGEATIEIEDPETMESAAGGEYIDAGTLYLNVETGKYYMLDEENRQIEVSPESDETDVAGTATDMEGGGE